MKRVLQTICVVGVAAIVTGCASMSTSLAPGVTPKPVPIIGIAGAGTTMATPSFMEFGYRTKDLGNDTYKALDRAREQGIGHVVIVDPVGVSGSGATLQFSMRVTETATETVVWSGTTTKMVWALERTKKEKEAMGELVRDFAKTFPPAGGLKEQLTKKSRVKSAREVEGF